MFAALVFLLTLAASIAATGAILPWLRRRELLDHPNERSSHSAPTPRGGGLALIPVLLAAWAVCVISSGAPGRSWFAIGAAALLLALSWVDDKRGLAVALRLAGHVLAVAIGLVALPADAMVFHGFLPVWADRIVTGLAWVWFVNLYNFMDGIDGITGVETASIGLGLAVVALLGGSGGDPSLALAVAAVGLGFLRWNWHPARLFLGDAGSVPLGYLLGWLLIAAATEGHWTAALILPGYYWADATLTLFRRVFAGEKVWQAHRRHLYQGAVGGGASHALVATMIALGNLSLVALAAWATIRPWPALAAAALVVAVLLVSFARMSRATPSPPTRSGAS